MINPLTSPPKLNKSSAPLGTFNGEEPFETPAYRSGVGPEMLSPGECLCELAAGICLSPALENAWLTFPGDTVTPQRVHCEPAVAAPFYSATPTPKSSPTPNIGQALGTSQAGGRFAHPETMALCT